MYFVVSVATLNVVVAGDFDRAGCPVERAVGERVEVGWIAMPHCLYKPLDIPFS